jgi:hypothetical protein
MTDFLLMVGGALFAMFISGIVNYKKTKWVNLTDEEIQECAGEYPWTPTGMKCIRTVEAKLKEKNT